MGSIQRNRNQPLTVTIDGQRHTISREDVVSGVRYKRPDYGGVRPGVTWYAVVNKRKVPAKWALRMALEIPGANLQTNHAVLILQRLGFATGQDDND